jgi:hypothetical protein
MATSAVDSVGILVRGDREAREKGTVRDQRLMPLFDALGAVNVAVEPVIFGEEMVEEARRQLAQLDGVLVWVDPITDGRDRARLDELLRDVSSKGVWVSAHPDVIMKMGTKEVLFDTRELVWGGDIHLYKTPEEFRAQFPARLASGGARVLKQHRGNGGIGVWKVELVGEADPGAAARSEATVRVQHAAPRDTSGEELPLSDFMKRCGEYFEGGGRIIDQPFQPRIVDGMIRCYMVRDKVAGFAHQSPDPSTTEGPGHHVFGLPAKKTMFEASEPRFASLRAQMESDWIPGLQRLVDVDDESLPMLWDADFLYGPKTANGDDTYVLCEINCSCVSPFPEAVIGKLANAVAGRLKSAKV